MKLRLADGLSMDASEAATQTFAALAGKGQGKSYLAGKFVEQLVGASCPTVVVEPVGNWWPLRLGKDGKSPGLPIVVIGGEHGDVPVEPTQGAEVGRFLVETNGSAVIDVSGFSKTKRQSFVADFAEAFYIASRKAATPRMLVLEEAQVFAPQHAARGQERMLGAMTDIVRLGRNHGIGSMLVSQRPQSVSKEVLNMVECLFVGGMRGPHERKAIAGWVTEQADGEGEVAAQLRRLPELQPGDFFCWSPSWLSVAKPIRVLPKDTFDGTSTPKLGGSRARAPKLAPVDVSALTAALTPPAKEPPKPGSGPSNHAHVERELRGELAEAKRRLAASLAEGAELREGLRQIHAALDRLLATMESTTLGKSFPGEPVPANGRGDAEQGGWAPRPPALALAAGDDAATVGGRPTKNGASASGDYALALLRSLVAYGPSTRLRLSLVSGKSRTSSTFAAALRELKAVGLVEESSGELRATADGKQSAGKVAVPKGYELFDHWCARLAAYDRRNFQVLAGRARGYTRAELSDMTGHSRTSSSFAASLRRLRGLGLVSESGGALRISDQAKETMEL